MSSKNTSPFSSQHRMPKDSVQIYDQSTSDKQWAIRQKLKQGMYIACHKQDNRLAILKKKAHSKEPESANSNKNTETFLEQISSLIRPSRISVYSKDIQNLQLYASTLPYQKEAVYFSLSDFYLQKKSQSQYFSLTILYKLLKEIAQPIINELKANQEILLECLQGQSFVICEKGESLRTLWMLPGNLSLKTSNRQEMAKRHPERLQVSIRKIQKTAISQAEQFQKQFLAKIGLMLWMSFFPEQIFEQEKSFISFLKQVIFEMINKRVKTAQLITLLENKKERRRFSKQFLFTASAKPSADFSVYGLNASDFVVEEGSHRFQTTELEDMRSDSFRKRLNSRMVTAELFSLTQKRPKRSCFKKRIKDKRNTIDVNLQNHFKDSVPPSLCRENPSKQFRRLFDHSSSKRSNQFNLELDGSSKQGYFLSEVKNTLNNGRYALTIDYVVDDSAKKRYSFTDKIYKRETHGSQFHQNKKCSADLEGKNLFYENRRLLRHSEEKSRKPMLSKSIFEECPSDKKQKSFKFLAPTSQQPIHENEEQKRANKKKAGSHRYYYYSGRRMSSNLKNDRQLIEEALAQQKAKRRKSKEHQMMSRSQEKAMELFRKSTIQSLDEQRSTLKSTSVNKSFIEEVIGKQKKRNVRSSFIQANRPSEDEEERNLRQDLERMKNSILNDKPDQAREKSPEDIIQEAVLNAHQQQRDQKQSSALIENQYFVYEKRKQLQKLNQNKNHFESIFSEVTATKQAKFEDQGAGLSKKQQIRGTGEVFKQKQYSQLEFKKFQSFGKDKAQQYVREKHSGKLSSNKFQEGKTDQNQKKKSNFEKEEGSPTKAKNSFGLREDTMLNIKQLSEKSFDLAKQKGKEKVAQTKNEQSDPQKSKQKTFQAGLQYDLQKLDTVAVIDKQFSHNRGKSTNSSKEPKGAQTQKQLQGNNNLEEINRVALPKTRKNSEKISKQAQSQKKTTEVKQEAPEIDSDIEEITLQPAKNVIQSKLAPPKQSSKMRQENVETNSAKSKQLPPKNLAPTQGKNDQTHPSISNKKVRKNSQQSDKHKKLLTGQSSVASSYGPNKSVKKTVDEYIYMINKIGEAVAKTPKVSKKIEGVTEWYVGVFFLYKRFLYERKKIEKWIKEGAPKLTRYDQIDLDEWKQYLKSPERQALTTKISEENVNISKSIVKMQKKLLERNVPQSIKSHAVLNQRSFVESRIAVEAVIQEHDVLSQTNILAKDKEIFTHVCEMLNACLIVAELDKVVEDRLKIGDLTSTERSASELEEIAQDLFDIYHEDEDEDEDKQSQS